MNKIPHPRQGRGSDYVRNVFDYYKEDNYLAHHGIKDQKWGIRRFQNPDGTLTPAGRERYGRALAKGIKKADSNGISATDTISRVHKNLAKNKAVISFEKNNKTAKELDEIGRKRVDINVKMNKEINDKLTKEFGKPFMQLAGDQQIAYVIRGRQLAQEYGKRTDYQELIKNGIPCLNNTKRNAVNI